MPRHFFHDFIPSVSCPMCCAISHCCCAGGLSRRTTSSGYCRRAQARPVQFRLGARLFSAEGAALEFFTARVCVSLTVLAYLSAARQAAGLGHFLTDRSLCFCPSSRQAGPHCRRWRPRRLRRGHQGRPDGHEGHAARSAAPASTSAASRPRRCCTRRTSTTRPSTTWANLASMRPASAST
jgi:hypothetical protein